MDLLKPADRKRYRGACLKSAFKSLAVVPVRYRQKVLGAIHLADEKQNMAPPETVSFLESMAMLVGEAIHRFNTENDLRRSQKQLRLLTSQLSLVEEKERRRIANDLHDSVGQILAFTARELKTLKKSSPDRISDAIGEVCNQLDQAIKQTRSLSFDLSPSILYDLGLEVALEDLTERFGQERKIQCRFESVPGPKPLAEDVKIFLYRAVRELLINVAKHAHAHAIRILLGKSGGEIYITVEDDGLGFDSSQLESSLGRPKGFGIFSIRERLGHIGGRLEIESARGKGTKVTLVAPLGN
jgi:signal transduction histidine kinase